MRDRGDRSLGRGKIARKAALALLALTMAAACASTTVETAPAATVQGQASAPLVGPSAALATSATESPQPTPAPSAGSATFHLPPGPLRALPAGTFALRSGVAYALVRGVSPSGAPWRLSATDVTTGVATRLVTISERHGVSQPVLAADRILWVESWFTGTPRPCTGCNMYPGQPMHWQIRSVDLVTRAVTVVQAGLNSRTSVEGEGAGPLPPVIAADGDRLAYTIEKARPDAVDGTLIVLLSLSSGAETTVFSAGYVAQILLAGHALAYRQAIGQGKPGTVNTGTSDLLVRRTDDETPRLVASHVQDASMTSTALAWASSESLDSSIEVAPLASLTPERVPGPPLNYDTRGQPGPSRGIVLGPDLIAWIVPSVDANDAWSSELVLRRLGDATGRVVADVAPLDVGLGDGELWWSDLLGTDRVNAVAVAAIQGP